MFGVDKAKDHDIFICGHFSIPSKHFWDPALNHVISKTVL